MKDEPEINITPLIDVVFVILIMFIIIAPLLEMDQVILANGTGGEEVIEIKEGSQIQILVKNDNRVFLNQQETPIAFLAERLKQERGAFPDAIPQLYHDKGALFGTYQEVKNAATFAGFSELDIVLNPHE
ncbi:biopolymer transporter ExbD [Chlamydiales bacterium]|nr:biopolymer transporter ExbD [Chlamydiales bacterium]